MIDLDIIIIIKIYIEKDDIMSQKNTTQKDNKEVKGFLKGVERLGNALPNPAIIFVILSIAIIIISAVVASMGIEESYFDARTGENVTVKAISLLNAEGLRYIFNSATKNFTSFAPLGTVLVAMLGVGVAEWTGLIIYGQWINTSYITAILDSRICIW